MVAARASRRSVASPGRRRGRTSSRSSDQRGSRRSTTGPDASPAQVSHPGRAHGQRLGTGGLDRRSRPPTRLGQRPSRRPGSARSAASGPTTAGRARAGPAGAAGRPERDSSCPSPGNSSSSDGHAAALELDVEPGALLQRAAPVLLGVDDQRRRGDRRGVGHRALRGEPLRVGAEVLVGEAPADVGGPDEADRVDERALADGGHEPRGAADQERRQVAAVGAAHDADPVGVERRVGQRRVEEGEDVGGVELAEAALDRPPVRLAVARRAARVALHDRVPGRHVGLGLVEQRPAVLRERAAVDGQQHRVRAGSRRRGDPAVHRVAVRRGRRPLAHPVHPAGLAQRAAELGEQPAPPGGERDQLAGRPVVGDDGDDDAARRRRTRAR